MNLKPLRHYFGLLLLLLVVWPGLPEAFGQRPGAGNQPLLADSLSAATDSAGVAVPKGDIDTTIKYSARDSIVSEVASKVMHLYGNASLEYGTMTLKADYIRIDWETNTLTAEGSVDSTGQATGRPIFRDDQEYEADRIVYNYKTRKGRVSGVVTKQQEGFIHAEVIKKNEDNEIFGWHARYTTCDLKHPHFYINAKKMKAIPKDRIISGPFNMVFADIPTPFGLPFGFFPSPDKRASGIIMPTFGETRQRGFFLRNLGYYLALNDYIGMRLTGDVYSFGGYAARLDGNYIKRYAFSGNFGLDYSFIPANNTEGRSRSTVGYRGSSGDRSDFRVRWSHRPVPRNGKSFSASVNAGTFFYNQRNSFVASEILAPSFNSNISYQVAKPNSPFNYTLSLGQSQNSQTQSMSFTLPDFSFGMSRQNPFLLLTGKESTGGWLEDIGISYLFNARNYITNDIPSLRPAQVTPGEQYTVPITRDNLPLLLKNAQIGARHSIPITLSSFRLFKYIQLSPSISYNENWYLQRKNYSWDEELNQVRVDTIRKFSRVYNYSGSASLTTRIYGTAYIKGKKVEAIRHIITPSVSYSYRPDFSAQAFDFYQSVQSDSLGNHRLRSRYEGSLYGAPGSGRASTFSFSLDNNVEMKVKNENDTTGTKAFEKVRLIDFFRISSGYNVAADSFQLQQFNVGLGTMLFNKVNINANSTFDPYRVNAQGTRVNEYYFNPAKLKLARMLQASVNANYEFNPSARKPATEAPPTNLQHLNDSPLYVEYLDFNIPWTLSLQTTAGFYPATFPGQPDRTSASVGFNGSLSLTDKWKISYNSSYDFVSQNLTYTTINIHRDLHCWEMNFSWVPFGLYQTFSFNINAKASLLRDLKYTRNRTANEFR